MGASSDVVMIPLTLFDPRNFRFADRETQSRHKCDSSGETIDTSDSEEYTEQDAEEVLEWGQSRHWESWNVTISHHKEQARAPLGPLS